MAAVYLAYSCPLSLVSYSKYPIKQSAQRLRDRRQAPKQGAIEVSIL